MNPAAFFLLLAIPIFYVFRKTRLLQRISFPITFADWNGYVFSWNDKLLKFASALSTALALTAFLLVVIAFADYGYQCLEYVLEVLQQGYVVRSGRNQYGKCI